MNKSNTLILFGYKTCGKSTLGKVYAQTFQRDFIDTDTLMIERFKQPSEGLTISQLYQRLGESKFRLLEANLIQTLKPVEPTIIATGGGAVMSRKTVAYLKSLGPLIYLKVAKEILFERLFALSPLPSFIDKNNIMVSLNHYLTSRDQLYESIADYNIACTNQTTIMSLLKSYEAYNG